MDPFVIALLVFRSIPVDYVILAVVLGSFTVLLSAWVLYDEILTDDEKSDNTEDKGSADEKPEEYREDETDLYDIIVNKPAETTDEKPADAATETPYGTAGTGAEDETDDKD